MNRNRVAKYLVPCLTLLQAKLVVCDDILSGTTLCNWSGTHVGHPQKLFEPKNSAELLHILAKCKDNGEKCRPIGTTLSPNGIAMPSVNNAGSSISLSNFDSIRIDEKTMEVTVGAGVTVAALLQELKKRGLTLENFSSIQEQQVAGWTQVGSHGTGCFLSTVDDMIVNMTVAIANQASAVDASPGMCGSQRNGLLYLSKSSNKRLFEMAKVGLGSLGVVTELTLRCVPRFYLQEYTTVQSRQEFASTGSAEEDEDSVVRQAHYQSLKDNRHVRYMWLPHTDTVVKVTSNETKCHIPSSSVPVTSPSSPLVQLIHQLGYSDKPSTALEQLSLPQLREIVLNQAFEVSNKTNGADPLTVIKRLNRAEAAYWSRLCCHSSSSSSDKNGGKESTKATTHYAKVGESVDILGFDCGGQQLVYEVCFPIGTLQAQSGKDLDFMRDVLAVIERHEIAAPCPLEQRWTRRSTSLMSPAYSRNPDDVFCWVGIIMYLPHDNENARKEIEQLFKEYCLLLQPICDKYDAHPHWAKIEMRQSMEEQNSEGERGRSSYASHLRQKLNQKYPLCEFNAYRAILDPTDVLTNDLLDSILK